MPEKTTAMTPLIEMHDLQICVHGDGAPATVVDGVSFSLSQGKVTALVGASGSGKSLLARSLVRLLPDEIKARAQSYKFNGVEYAQNDLADTLGLRGTGIGYIFQEPLSTLNPALKVSQQLTEGLRFHRKMTSARAHLLAVEMLEKLNLPDAASIMDIYPHQLSGGMRQRVMIAAAMLLAPKLLVADEPTTALDSLLRKDTLAMLKSLAVENSVGVLLITHDIGSIVGIADDVIVMREGKIVEVGALLTVLNNPQSEYTRLLIEAAPGFDGVKEPAAPKQNADTALIELRSINAEHHVGRQSLFKKLQTQQILHDISLKIHKGECLGLVGASGSGKTTLARTLLGLHEVSAGEVLAHGESRSPNPAKDRFQFIYQDSAGALDPRMRVYDLVEEALLIDCNVKPMERRERVRWALRLSRLEVELESRFPHQLSGGQRQRVCIARAIVTSPQLIIADEPVSALDLTIQKKIILLFRELRQALNFSCVFISHDFGVIEDLCDRVCVLKDGRIVEIGAASEILETPAHEYTKQLIRAGNKLQKREGGGYSLRSQPAVADSAVG